MGAAVKWQKRHFWLYLMALDFDPVATQEAWGINLKLRPSMFDKPNYSAFQVIAEFLFSKLDKERSKELFKDNEFRKVCYSWLKEIAREDKSFPRFASSVLLTPTGHKFMSVIYHFVRYTVIADLKKNYEGNVKPLVEIVDFRSKGARKIRGRCRVARNELLQILLKKDYMIKKYKEKSRCLIEEIQEIKAECAQLQQRLQKMESNNQNRNDRAERIQKVRSMWTVVMETFTSLKKEMEIVDSVLQRRVDRYILDGTDDVSVPYCLVDRVESATQEVCTGNLYEDEKLNLLTVIQLLNEALKIVRDEYHQFEVEKYLQNAVNITEFQKKILLNLEAVRLRIEKQHFILNESNSKNLKEWKTKWEGFPSWSSLYSHRFGLSTLQAHNREDGTFCQNPESVSDILDLLEINYENDDETLESKVADTSLTPALRISSEEVSEAAENRDLLTEKDLHFETYSEKEKPVPPKNSKCGEDKLTLSQPRENIDHVMQRDAPDKNEYVLEKARDKLAEEVARTVTSDSPQSSGGKGMSLEELISSLEFNPFLTRKQIPRTPENLLTEIRNSWRKAIQPEDLSHAQLVSTEEKVDAPVDARPIVQDKAAISLAGASSSSAVPVLDHPFLEQKTQGSSAEFTAQKQRMISHISESLLCKTSGMLEAKSSKEELEGAVSGGSFIGRTEEPICMNVKKSLNTVCSENNSKMNTLPSNYFLDLVNRNLQWNVTPVFSSDNCEVADFGILHETVPEEFNCISPNKSAMSESSFGFFSGVYTPDSTINKENTQNLRLGLDSLLSRNEMLKKNSSEKGQELHQMPTGDDSLIYLSDLRRTSEEGRRDDLCIRLPRFNLDEEFTKITSLPDKHPSLSPLLAFSKHLEEVASNINEIPLGLIHKLKDKEELEEKLSSQESPS
ncbi:hypothetical protein ASZ78_013274 [Callipepla squamata]|uniref:HAUS augmin-like complex subunit 6 N-terminal domain-containing protein n=1 Tax=Callipepla squamata TaxID=9009 RepID=A0A226N8D4_CALSU|nr:hypothetical protein ASZ78_013274 [Callipepla squamata]